MERRSNVKHGEIHIKPVMFCEVDVKNFQESVQLV